MGRLPGFPFDTKQFKDRWMKYREEVETGKWPRADISHFCGLNGISLDQLIDTVKDESTPEGLTREIKKFVTWVQGQYMVASGWSGPHTAKAIFALKQDYGGGYTYTDRADVKASGDISIKVDFGGGKGAFD